MDARSEQSAAIVVTVDGDCATVSLTRPHVRNAQTPEMWNQLAEIDGVVQGAHRCDGGAGDGRGG